MDRNQAVIFLENVLACYCGNSLTSFGLTESRKTSGQSSNYGFFIKEVPTETAKRNRECFVQRNNLMVKEEGGLIVYQSK